MEAKRKLNIFKFVVLVGYLDVELNLSRNAYLFSTYYKIVIFVNSLTSREMGNVTVQQQTSLI